MTNNTNERIKKIMSVAFEIPLENITEEATVHSISKWDSLNHMKLVIALEDEFKIKFDQEEMLTLINFRIISATISSYL